MLLSCVSDLAFNKKMFFFPLFVGNDAVSLRSAEMRSVRLKRVLPVSEAVYSINVICHNIVKMQAS